MNRGEKEISLLPESTRSIQPNAETSKRTSQTTMAISRRAKFLPVLLLLLQPTSISPAFADATSTTTSTSTGGGAPSNLFETRSLDLQKCYYDILMAANYDKFLSQSDFIAFVQLSSNHTVGHVNQWGANITSFSMLDAQLIKIYNLHACGDPLVGCPSIEGIDIGEGGLKLQMDSAGNGGLLNQICGATYSAIEEITAVAVSTISPTLGPTTLANNTNGLGDNNANNMTSSPSSSTGSSSSPTVAPNIAPGIGDACPPIYVPNTPYDASSLVINPNDNSSGSNTKVYACKGAPFTPWCSQSGYEPGVSFAWQEAWTIVGECNADAGVNGSATTVSPTVNTASTTAPYSTTLASVFPTMTLSTIGTTGTMTTPTNGISTVMPDDITPSPTPMVVGPSKVPTVENTDDPLYTGTLTIPFQYEIGNDAYLRAHSIETGTDPINDMLNILLESTSTLVEEVVSNTFGLTRRGLRSNLGRVRRLQVVYSPDTVVIDKLENIFCPASLPSEALCQSVFCQVDLVLTNEPKMSTELRFRNELYKAIDNGAMSFPKDSSIVYTHSPRSSVSVLPEITSPQPDEGDTESGDDSDENSWVLPVSIACAVVGVLLLSLLLGLHVARGRHKAEAALIQQSLEGDDLDDNIKGRREGAMGQERTYYKHDVKKENVVESSKFQTKEQTQSFNPFIESSSSSSSSSSFSSSSQSSMSESDVSSSTEDLDERKQNRSEVDTSNLEPYRLPTLVETSNEDLATSGASLQSSQSMYRAGVEALIKEACPEELDNLDSIMNEYEGREEQLIGQLSSMLAAMNRNSVVSDEDGSGGSGENKTVGDSAMLSSTSNTASTSDNRDLSSGHEAVQSQIRRALAKKESPTEQDTAKLGNTAAAAAAATLFTGESRSTGLIDHYSSSDESSSAGSSDWSTDEGLSSVDASLGTVGSVVNTTPSMLSAIGVASSIAKQVGLNDVASLTSESDERQTATRRDLNEAIEAGDWSAVSATAALLAKSNTGERRGYAASISETSISSGSSFGQQSLDRASEFAKLVEEGDWEGVMRAAAQYEGASDTSSLVDSRKSLLDMSDAEIERSKWENLSGEESFNIRDSLESLIREVVPDEIDNIEEMLAQFRGREQDLINTLRTMRDQKGSTPTASPNEVYASPGIISAAPSSSSIFESDSIKSPWWDDSSKTTSSFNNGSDRSDASS